MVNVVMHHRLGVLLACTGCHLWWPAGTEDVGALHSQAQSHLDVSHPELRRSLAGGQPGNALDSVLALHCEVGVYDVCEHTNGDECDAWETVDGEFVCGAPVDRVCDECRDECGDRLGYPCATVSAITDALGEDA